jgi:ethanolamine ammonia-lyase small subunit
MSKRDPWHKLGVHTPARNALGRIGGSLPTGEVLAFALAHAQARDAVHAALDCDALHEALAPLGHPVIDVTSAAADRATYLRRPDLGRQLPAASATALGGHPPCELAFVIADGLSARAVMAHAALVVRAVWPRLGHRTLGPIVIASQGRVALGDAIGAALSARMVAVLIGERPGLSTADSLGIYLTHDPRPGRDDSQRNCISNIHAGGLSADAAAVKLAWLIEAAFARSLTGVGLKDESDRLIRPPSATGLPAPARDPHKR